MTPTMTPPPPPQPGTASGAAGAPGAISLMDRVVDVHVPTLMDRVVDVRAPASAPGAGSGAARSRIGLPSALGGQRGALIMPTAPPPPLPAAAHGTGGLSVAAPLTTPAPSGPRGGGGSGDARPDASDAAERARGKGRDRARRRRGRRRRRSCSSPSRSQPASQRRHRRPWPRPRPRTNRRRPAGRGATRRSGWRTRSGVSRRRWQCREPYRPDRRRGAAPRAPTTEERLDDALGALFTAPAASVGVPPSAAAALAAPPPPAGGAPPLWLRLSHPAVSSKRTSRGPASMRHRACRDGIPMRRSSRASSEPHPY